MSAGGGVKLSVPPGTESDHHILFSRPVEACARRTHEKCYDSTRGKGVRAHEGRRIVDELLPTTVSIGV